MYAVCMCICFESACCFDLPAQVVIVFKYDDDGDDTEIWERNLVMYLPGTTPLTVRGLMALTQVMKNT